MATGGPNENGIPARPAPDESLWLAEEPLGPNPTGTQPPTPRPATPPRHPRPRWGNSRQTFVGGSGRTRDAGRSQAADYSSCCCSDHRPGNRHILDCLDCADRTSRRGAKPASLLHAPRSDDDNSLNILIGLAQNAPAWLINALWVVHTSLLIILGVCLAAVEHKPQVEPPGINLSDQIGEAARRDIA